MTTDLNDLSAWIGRSETLRDQIGATPVKQLNATLDHPQMPVETGMALPPLWHWLYFLPLHRQSEIGPDGHARRGGFLPPVPLPRRMWAGSQFEFRSPVRVGDAVERMSTIADVSAKEGRTGKLVFVKVRHDVRCNGSADPAIVEFHDIVYREARRPDDVEPPPQRVETGAVSGSGSPGRETRTGGQRPDEARGHPFWQRVIVPDDVLLFRYSALTFNGHRIHYDRKYVTEVEGYPGLIVHGPLIATLLLDLVRRNAPDADVATFRFKAVRPTFDLNPFSVNGQVIDSPHAAMAPAPSGRPGGGREDGKAIKLWAEDHEGWLTMDALATLR